MKFLFAIIPFLISCGQSKPRIDPTKPTESIASQEKLEISETDWITSSDTKNEILITKKNLKPDVLIKFEKYFNILQAIDVASGTGSIYRKVKINKIANEKDQSFIIPKAVVHSKTAQGTLLGLTSDPSSKGLIHLSIPIALVDGTVPVIPNASGGSTGANAALALPDSWVNKADQNSIKTLPTCISHVSIRYGIFRTSAKLAKNDLNLCQHNQFQRIEFIAPRQNIERLLEQAALHEGSVELEISLSISDELVTEVTSLEIPKQLLLDRWEKNSESTNILPSNSEPSFALEQRTLQILSNELETLQFNIEDAMNASFAVADWLDDAFPHSTSCTDGTFCRTKNTSSKIPGRISLLLLKRKALSTSLTFSERVPLVAPGVDLPFEVASQFPEPLDHASISANTPDQYQSLGGNVTVFPGAWIKIELESIEEKTTSTIRKLANGRSIIESEAIDLLGGQTPLQRTQCVQGNFSACEEIEMAHIPVRSSDGNILIDASSHKPIEITRPAYDCRAEDQVEHCPYYETIEMISGNETENDCQKITHTRKAGFLSFSADVSSEEIVCNAKSIKPTFTKIRKPVCGKNGAPFETNCVRPILRCQKWNTQCSHYHLNQQLQLAHESLESKWRHFSLADGEFPLHFEEQLYLRFQSPNHSANHCLLRKFPRKLRGKTLLIQIPRHGQEPAGLCDQPIWNENTIKPLNYPKVWISNNIQYPQTRRCGRSEFRSMVRDIPTRTTSGLIPESFINRVATSASTLPQSCQHSGSWMEDGNAYYHEYSPIRFSGKISVLGRILESILLTGQETFHEALR